LQAGLLDIESQRIDLVGRLRQEDAKPAPRRAPSVQEAVPMAGPGKEADAALTGLLGEEFTSIDLGSALSLAGVQNPKLLLARQRVVESVAERQLAAAELLPSLRAGVSFDAHSGPLQQSFGNILRVARSAVYVGAGSYAIAAGTVNIPGVYWNGNVSQTIFRYLSSRQVVEKHTFESRAVENEVLREVGVGYTNLLRSVGQRAIAYENQQDAVEVVRLTEAFARAGAGREADADRSRSELASFTSRLREAEGEMLIASAELAEVLNLDPSTRLVPLEERYVPLPYVPDPIPLPELLAIALVQRPELQSRQASIQQAMLDLRSARLLPFSPNMIIGLSAGHEAGGSNIVDKPAGTTPFASDAARVGRTGRFGNGASRLDFDAVGYWMLTNFGVGNRAMVREAESHLRTSELEWLAELDHVRLSVAEAYARTHASYAQILTAEDAVRDASRAFAEEKRRISAVQGLPIELLDALRLVSQSRREYLQAIIAYNQAQLELYVALGQPPVALLARPALREGSPPPPGGVPGMPLPPAQDAVPTPRGGQGPR
jgi:outer membrane protein TolC